MSESLPVSARGLVKLYGELVAVDHVDLTVEKGDVFGYLGPNGAGKTTSLRMLLGLIRPTEGSIELFGRDPHVAGAKALDGVAGFVEGPTFYPYLTARRNLRLLAAYDDGDSRSRIEELLELVELSDRGDDKVGGYSHGMRQRLGIAAALLRDPKLLLLDEPTTGLDPAGMRDMRDLVRRLAGEGITVLLSSHLLTEVEELCNRVAIIRKGRIVYEGQLQDLLSTAATGFRLRSPELDRAKALLLAQPGGPNDVPLGRYIRDTGLAAPFVVLFFMSIWGLPLITALVAGDIVAAESHNDTLKTILTRSRDRGQVFAGKVLAVLTYTFVVVFALGLVGLAAGSIAWGFHPLTSLSGTKVAPGHGLVLLLGSLLVYFLPLAGIACFGLMLSTVTRNSAASVVGSLMFALLMQLLGVLPGTETIRPYLLGTQFEAWHGFLRTPADWVPVIRALWVCALYLSIPVAAAYLVFLRRDVASQ